VRQAPLKQEHLAERQDPVDLDCPEVNPHRLGVPEPPLEGRALFPLAPDPEAIARIEAELERLRKVEAERSAQAVWHPPSTLSVTAFLTSPLGGALEEVGGTPTTAASLGTATGAMMAIADPSGRHPLRR
jgi:hypothetical protein